MTHRPSRPQQTLRHRRAATCAAVLGACVASLQPAFARTVPPPPVPMKLEVPAGQRLFRVEHAIGTQNYICLPSTKTPVAWEVAPQATLFNDHRRQTMTHFQSPNPDEGGTLRPTWQDSKDSSAVWGTKVGGSTDPVYVAPDAIAWLLLRVVGQAFGPTGGHDVTRATFLQRLNTARGQAPATGCEQAADIGHRASVPYTADYYFFRAINPVE